MPLWIKYLFDTFSYFWSSITFSNRPFLSVCLYCCYYYHFCFVPPSLLGATFGVRMDGFDEGLVVWGSRLSIDPCYVWQRDVSSIISAKTRGNMWQKHLFVKNAHLKILKYFVSLSCLWKHVNKYFNLLKKGRKSVLFLFVCATKCVINLLRLVVEVVPK